MAGSSAAGLRERLAEVLQDSKLQLHLGQAVVAHCGVVHLSARQAGTIAGKLLPVVEAHTAEQTARLAVERGRFRAAWKNARWYATGFRERYQYERKLCHNADVRAAKAIRDQLAAEAERDRLRAALSRALDLLGREEHCPSSCTAQGIAVLRTAHDGSKETTR